MYASSIIVHVGYRVARPDRQRRDPGTDDRRTLRVDRCTTTFVPRLLDARAPTGRDGDTVVDVRLQEVVHQDVSFSAEYSEGEVIPLVQHRGPPRMPWRRWGIRVRCRTTNRPPERISSWRVPVTTGAPPQTSLSIREACKPVAAQVPSVTRLPMRAPTAGRFSDGVGHPQLRFSTRVTAPTVPLRTTSSRRRFTG